MNKIALKTGIESVCNQMTESVKEVNDEQFFAPFGEKWSIAENVLHLTQSVKQMNQALSMPKEMLAQMFGKADRPSMSYQEMIDKYLNVLTTGVQARGAFVPQMPENPNKNILLQSFLKHHQILADALANWTNEELDLYFIKHPVLKNLTMKEMYWFMHYHIGHHQKAIDRILA
jgi:hypothetical protein